MFKAIGIIISFCTLAIIMVLGTGGLLGYYLDVPSLVILFGIVFGGVMFTYSDKAFTYFSYSWKAAIPSKELFKVLEFYNYLTKLTLTASIIAFLAGAILILLNFDQAAEIGPSLAMLILTNLYAVTLSYLVIQPIKHSILFKAMSKS